MKLMIRKVQFAPDTDAAAPSVETTRDFVMSDKPLHVKTSLDKEVRGHTELSCVVSHLWQVVVSGYLVLLLQGHFSPGVPGGHLTAVVIWVTGVLPWRAHQGARQRHQQLQQECQEHNRLR